MATSIKAGLVRCACGKQCRVPAEVLESSRKAKCPNCGKVLEIAQSASITPIVFEEAPGHQTTIEGDGFVPPMPQSGRRVWQKPSVVPMARVLSLDPPPGPSPFKFSWRPKLTPALILLGVLALLLTGFFSVSTAKQHLAPAPSPDDFAQLQRWAEREMTALERIKAEHKNEFLIDKQKEKLQESLDFLQDKEVSWELPVAEVSQSAVILPGMYKGVMLMPIEGDHDLSVLQLEAQRRLGSILTIDPRIHLSIGSTVRKKEAEVLSQGNKVRIKALVRSVSIVTFQDRAELERMVKIRGGKVPPDLGPFAVVVLLHKVKVDRS